MKVLVQRVKRAGVEVGGEKVAAIAAGLLVFVGVEKGDARLQAEYLAAKVANLRIFEDENQKMNLSALDIGGEIIVVSQFTLAGDCTRGNRPGFDNAARPEDAKPLYEYFSDCLRAKGLHVENGIFQADMQVSLINDGPVTFVLEKK
ncbi:MAG: D-aminoacyl-tRNA deacylase [Alphaproteobacteria bacterium]